MNFKLIRYIVRRFSKAGKRQRFLNFAKLVALVSVMLGSMALIISLSVLEGFEKTLLDNAVKFRSHITVSTFNRESIKNFNVIKKTLVENVSGIKKISPVLQKEGLVRSKSNIEGILIRGLEPENDVSGISGKIIDGKKIFTDRAANEVIIGKRLATKLDAQVGDKLILYTAETTDTKSIPDTKIDKFIISGIYRTGMAEYDDIYVYIPFQKAVDFFMLPENAINHFEINLSDINLAQKKSTQIEELLGYPYYSRTVFDIHRSIFAWIELQKKPIPIVLALISIVAVLNIITTLLITVVEKTKSIGILRTLGMNNRSILSIFLVQGVTISLIGTLIGSGIGLLFYWLQSNFEIIKLSGEVYFLDVLPVEFALWHYVIVIGVSLILAFLGTLIPSLVAVKITPLKAIRFR